MYFDLLSSVRTAKIIKILEIESVFSGVNILTKNIKKFLVIKLFEIEKNFEILLKPIWLAKDHFLNSLIYFNST